MNASAPAVASDTALRFDPRFADTVFLVEATDFERLALWEREVARGEFVWEDDPSGRGLCVGRVDGCEVGVSFVWIRLDGHRVCFYHGMSQVVDHRRIDQWIRDHYFATYDNGHRRAVTDAGNFSAVIHALRALRRAALARCGS